jgi:hypothetical protein
MYGEGRNASFLKIDQRKKRVALTDSRYYWKLTPNRFFNLKAIARKLQESPH